MIVTSYRVEYGRFAIGAYNINNLEQALGLFRGHLAALRDAKKFDFRKPGEVFVREYAKFVRAKSDKLLSSNTLEKIQAALLVEA